MMRELGHDDDDVVVGSVSRWEGSSSSEVTGSMADMVKDSCLMKWVEVVVVIGYVCLYYSM